MMNLQDMLSEALEGINNMSTEEFEAECKRFGYTPSVKVSYKMSSSVTPDMPDHRFTYKTSVVISNDMPSQFGEMPANMSSFQVAA